MTRVAIVHDYLLQMGGAERVVAALHRAWPEAPIFTTAVDRASLLPELRDAELRTSWLQHAPAIRAHFRAYLPAYPAAIASLDLRGFDLVISSSSAWAKAVRVPRGVPHVSYVHTPMRWVWEREKYFARESFSGFTRLLLHPVLAELRAWDQRTANRPTRIATNSAFVAARLQRVWGRTAAVIPPPVDLSRFSLGSGAGDGYLIVSRLAHYKRIDLAVAACTQLGVPLTVIGDGPARASLAAIAGPTVRFAGRASDAEVAAAYASCRAFLFPGEEDFGIAPLEANAAGRPVIAFGAGGALETVRDGVTGVLFNEPTVASVVAAITRAASIRWDAAALRAHAERYDEPRFIAAFKAFAEGR